MERLELKIPSTSSLIHINWYNADKQVLEKKYKMLIKKIADTSKLVTNTALNTKIWEVESKVPDRTKHITTTEFNECSGEIIDKNLKIAINEDLNTVE